MPTTVDGQTIRVLKTAVANTRLGCEEELTALKAPRRSSAGDIARAAVFLASESAGFVTGQTLHVNGGSYLA